MSGEPMSVGGVPPLAAEPTSMAERFPSFGAYAAWTATAPQNAAVSLDVARFHGFTGEVTFVTEPAVRLYLDGGVVYHAERTGDPSIGEGLLASGVVDTVQLKRGMVRVGDVEHLGRLFERDASIDRDAVLVALERSTTTIVQQLTNSIASAITVNAYRHHPSGIHRWFVPQPATPTASRPSSGVTQIDRSVVEELPVLGAAPRPKMAIEWTEPDLIDDGLGIDTEIARCDADRADWTAVPVEPESTPDPAPNVPGGAFRITWPDGTSDESIIPVPVNLPAEPMPSNTDQAQGDHAPANPVQPDGEPIPEPLIAAPTPAIEVTPAAVEIPPPLAVPTPMAAPTEPVLVEPEAPAVMASPTELALPPAPTFDTPPLVAPAPPAATPPPLSVAPVTPVPQPAATAPAPVAPAAPSAPVAPVASVTPSEPPAPTAPAPTAPVPSTTVEPLRIDRIPQPDAAVPDDVAAAVRRALQAIEDASNRSAIPQPTRPLDRLPELNMPAFLESTLDSDPVFAEPTSLTPPAASPTVADTAVADTADTPVAVFDGAEGFEDPVAEAPQPAAVARVDTNRADPAAAADAETPGAPLGFAPPTNDMRAEAVYERAAAEVQAELDDADTESQTNLDTEGSVGRPLHEPGKASVVFVEDEQVDTGERRSALRRLIGSLRNKDD